MDTNLRAVVVDFAAFRARREAEQRSLFDEAHAAPEAVPVASPAARPLDARAVAHRARMLQHLRTQTGR